MKKLIASCILLFLSLHFSAVWAFDIGQINAVAPESFREKCLLNLRCETDTDTKLTVCSREPLSVTAPVSDTGGKTAGGYHGLGALAIGAVRVLPTKNSTVVASRYFFGEYHFGQRYVGTIKIQV